MWLFSCFRLYIDVYLHYQTKNKDNMKELALTFKQERKRMKISQEELAEKAGVMQCTISRYENGKQDITLDTTIKLAKIIKSKDLFDKINAIITKSLS